VPDLPSDILTDEPGRPLSGRVKHPEAVLDGGIPSRAHQDDGKRQSGRIGDVAPVPEGVCWVSRHAEEAEGYDQRPRVNCSRGGDCTSSDWRSFASRTRRPSTTTRGVRLPPRV